MLYDVLTLSLANPGETAPPGAGGVGEGELIPRDSLWLPSKHIFDKQINQSRVHTPTTSLSGFCSPRHCPTALNYPRVRYQTIRKHLYSPTPAQIISTTQYKIYTAAYTSLPISSCENHNKKLGPLLSPCPFCLLTDLGDSSLRPCVLCLLFLGTCEYKNLSSW